jgi:deoxyribonuclease-4
MVNALNEAHDLGMSTVQVFTKNQQQWKAAPLDAGLVRDWLARLRELGWEKGGPGGTSSRPRGRVVSHASYLINLASVSDELFAKSVDLMTDEIERCAALSIPFLVHHPGSFVGWTLEKGVARLAVAYKELFRRTRGLSVVMCLEGTAGAGSSIGGPFEHLRDLRASIVEATGEPDRVGFCLDTCHLHAAGHDMSTRESARGVLAQFDELCGMSNLCCFHLNDSLGTLGSHLDRHTHIGEGFIGAGVGERGTSEQDHVVPPSQPRGAKPKPAKSEPAKSKPVKPKPVKPKPGSFSIARLRASGFAEVIAHPRCQEVPLILETPKEEAKLARATPLADRLDAINMKRLMSLLDDAPAQKPRRSARTHR